MKAGSWDLELQRASLSMPGDSWTQTKPINGQWANHVGSMLLGSLDSDANVSVVIVVLENLRQWLKQLETTPETLANSHCSLGMRRQ